MARKGSKNPPITLKDFSPGLNTRFSNVDIKETESPDLENVIFDFKGEIRKRNGYGRTGDDLAAIGRDQFLYRTSASVYYHIVYAGTAYYRRQIGTTPWVSFRTGLNATARAAMIQVDNFVYLNNNSDVASKWDGTTSTNVASIPQGNIMVYWQQRVWVAGQSTLPTKVSYSKANTALGDVETFTGTDTGFIFIGKDDGQAITGLAPLDNALIVFKERSIYKITYNESLLAYEHEVLDSTSGCIGRSAYCGVDNDVWFFTGYEVRKVGRDAQYFDQIRTTDMSVKISTEFSSLTTRSNAYMTYHKNNVYVAVSKGTALVDKIYVWDSRFNGWKRWSNIRVNGFFADSVNDKLYFSDHTSSKVYEFNSTYSDDGVAISAYWYSKRFDLEAIYLYKYWRWFHIVSKNSPGTLDIQFEILDNVGVRKTIERTINIGQDTPEGVWDAVEYNLAIWGGPEDTFDDPDLIYQRLGIGKYGISLQVKVSNDNLGEDLSMQALSLIYHAADMERYPLSHTS